MFKTTIFGLLHLNKQTNNTVRGFILKEYLLGSWLEAEYPPGVLAGSCKAAVHWLSPVDRPPSQIHTQSCLGTPPAALRAPPPYRTVHCIGNHPFMFAFTQRKYPRKYPTSTLGLTRQCWSRMGVLTNTGSHWSVQISSIASLPRTCLTFIHTFPMRNITNRRFSNTDGKFL